MSYKESWGSQKRYGKFHFGAFLPFYKGSFAPAKAAELARQAPQTHRRRFNGQRLTGKTRCIPVDSYKGGYGVASVGKPLQALPPSYKAPWGSQRRYTGAMLAMPIRMDGSPMPARTAMELPMSYKEPWGSQRRYGKGWSPSASPKPYRGGSVTNPKAPWQNPETGEVYVEHLSDAKRYGNRRYGGKLYAQRSCKHYQAKKPETADIT